jgi:hypothetical protein
MKEFFAAAQDGVTESLDKAEDLAQMHLFINLSPHEPFRRQNALAPFTRLDRGSAVRNNGSPLLFLLTRKFQAAK